MSKKILLCLFVCTVIQLAACAQSIVGTWKRTANVLENENGSSRDVQKMMQQSMPCAMETRYIFEAGGKQYTKSTGTCAMIDKMGTSNWKIEGNTIRLSQPGKAASDAVYTLAFSGDTVTFTHDYTPEERTTLHTKAKRIIITYQRAS